MKCETWERRWERRQPACNERRLGASNPARMQNKAPVTVLSAFYLDQHYNHTPQIHPIEGTKQ
jgi:hypothetical protein